MWQAARQQDKKIKELMVDHKKRAEKRRAYYESKMGDPKQLLRIVGTAVKLYPDADQFYQHENVKNLTLWQGDNETRIDRFDGRALLEYLPSRSDPIALESRQDRDIANELDFERYRDLVEVDRLEVTEQERLVEIDEEWTNILSRHKALLSLLNPKKEENKQAAFKFDYGTNDGQQDAPQVSREEEEQELLKEVDILSYIGELSDADREKLNEMASRYNIHNYVRLLRGAKKDRDKQLELLRRQQQHSGRSSKRRRGRSDGRRRYSEDSSISPPPHRSNQRRNSPTYEAYGNSSESEASDDDHPAKAESDNFIVFGTTDNHHSDNNAQDTKKRHDDVKTKHNTSVSKPTLKQPEKKLSPMEKLKLKMRAAFDDQILKDEEVKRKKERDAEIDKLHGSDNTEALLRLTKPSNEPRQATEERPRSRNKEYARKDYGSTRSRSRSPSRHRERSRDRERRHGSRQSRNTSPERHRSRGHKSKRRSPTRSRSRSR